MGEKTIFQRGLRLTAITNSRHCRQAEVQGRHFVVDFHMTKRNDLFGSIRVFFGRLSHNRHTQINNRKEQDDAKVHAEQNNNQNARALVG